MSTVEDSNAIGVAASGPLPKRRALREFFELSIGYALILAVIWTSRPLQRWLYWAAIAWFVFSIIWSFPGWKAMGCTVTGFWRSAWIVGVALVLAAGGMELASNLHTLHRPSGFVEWVLAFGGYTIWSLAQQFLLQGYFLARLVRLLPSATLAAVAAAVIFAIAHLPNPILTLLTLLWGLAACLVFIKTRNLWTLAMAHAIFGICVAITIPATVLHNMRVGLGYLHYRAPRNLQRSQSDHRVSTVAWVRAEAPTRR
ncbi:MAG: type II CAAX prenyl endopeptidase Rce1 family protein [Terracidiphilus sp.]